MQKAAEDRGPHGQPVTAVVEVSGVHWATEKAVVEAVLGRRAGVLDVRADPSRRLRR